MSAASDRELLELAAKAAGYGYTEYAEPNELSPDGWGFVRFLKGSNVVFWNPLTDDGDALRLAVWIELEVRQVHFASHAGRAGQFWRTERHAGDPYAATRRAIVRAAAEIGRAA